MVSMRHCVLAAFLASAPVMLIACDPGYIVRLDATVKTGAGPLAGAWVIPLDDVSNAARTGADGRVSLKHGGFLHYTAESPVLVYAPGHRVFVGFPARDFDVRDRSFFFNTEWDATLDAALESIPTMPGLPLRHDAGFEAVVPVADPDWCVSYLVAVGPHGVTTIAWDQPKGAPAGHGARRFERKLPSALARPVDVLCVAVCYSRAADGRPQSRWALVSDVVRLPSGPPSGK